MVTVGLTVGLAAVEVKPAGEEVHEYVLPDTDDAPMLVLAPRQIALAEPTLAFGKGFTVTTTESDLKQPVAVIVSVK